MFIAKIIFEIENADKSEEIPDDVYSLLGSWRARGQILNEEMPCSRERNSYCFYFALPRPDALESINDNFYARSSRRHLKEKNISISVEILGSVPDSMKVCYCEKWASFILFTHFICLESPLRCGDCFSPVPIYTIPENGSSSFALGNLRGWERDYRACDTLQMGCETGERFGLREMSQLDSSLTKRGRGICQSIFEATSTPTYYFLHRVQGRSAKLESERRRCPSCGSEWKLNETLHGLFDFQCDKCRLLSNIACLLR